MTDIQKRLFDLRDEKYAEFQAKLTPSAKKESIIGVRVPLVRDLAKELIKENRYEEFLNSLPHKYYDENMLHAVLLSKCKNYEEAVEKVNAFLPYVDNWAVCDILSPKIFSKHKEDLLDNIKIWCRSKKTYTCRFGIEMLMSFYLDGDFKPQYLRIPAKVKSEEYYVNMMIAWFFATALAKQWDKTVTIIENKVLGEWVHNKTIQKACESYRITDEQKKYLKGFKI